MRASRTVRGERCAPRPARFFPEVPRPMVSPENRQELVARYGIEVIEALEWLETRLLDD